MSEDTKQEPKAKKAPAQKKATTKVKITHPKPVGDGFGGMHPHGSTPELPTEIADLLIDRGMAEKA